MSYPATKSPCLVAGPWVGEFGYELMAWQGFLRKFSRQFDGVLVICQSGHDYLYADFADKIVNYDPPMGDTALWQHTVIDGKECFRVGNAIGIDNFKAPFRHFNPYWIADVTNSPFPPWYGLSAYSQEFIRYGSTRPRPTMGIAIHPRSTNKRGTDYVNLDEKYWDSIVSWFKDSYDCEVGTIGSHQGAFYVDDTVDKRGIELGELCDYLANVDLVVGPSSGPMH